MEKDDIKDKTNVALSDEQVSFTSSLSDFSSSSGEDSTLNLLGFSNSLSKSRSGLFPNFNGIGGSKVFSKFNVSSTADQMANVRPPLMTYVHCCENTLAYGFEFLGAMPHLHLTPQTEMCLLSLVHAVGSCMAPLISTVDSPSNQAVTGKDISIVSQESLLYMMGFVFS